MGDWNPKANEIFLQAIEIEATDRRQSYLEKACGDDAELRAAVDELLQANGEAGSFLESPPAEIEATIELAPVTERPGTMIGRYRLMEQVGEGGMGVVYVAEQREPVRRKVALKIIKPGMDSKDVIARFEAEQQALALMDHPNIAKVLDAGATKSGRPYFVMELVRGITITEYCDQNNLTTRERLELFVTVCHAIKHAHQKGVIHRDVKPSNVMVTLHDGEPVPKIIDFGVAKAINQRLTERTVYTQYSQMIGTPLYMSPEQAEMSGLDVDTRTDIYSLGVLLYELLTGTTPFDKKRIHEAAYDEIRRIIREEEPPKPSTRISTLGKTGTSISTHRKTDPRRLSHLVRGDLDWIVMRTLEKDRTRRYETANDLAADILRHLNNEPILASPPSVFYKLRKFARRNKVAVATVSLVAGALMLGLIASTWQAVRATRAERDLAKAHGKEMRLRADAEKERDRAVDAEQNAEQERDRAQAQRDESRRLLYTSDMAGALRAWEDGIVPQVDKLVERHRPKPGEEDLRGFEWYYLWRLRGQRMTVPALQHSGIVGSMDFSPDGSLLATADIDGNVAVWDIVTCQPRFQHNAYGTNVGPTVVFSPDGLTVASAGPRREKGKRWPLVVNLWDAATGRLKETLDLDGIQYLPLSPDGQLAFSPDGSLLAVACGGAIRLWDVADRKFRDSLVTQGSRPTFLAFAPSGKQIASNHEDGTVRLWDVETGRSQALAGPDYHTKCLDFSPRGNTLACGDEDGTLRLWDMATTTQRATLRISDRPVIGVAFSPDGNRLVALSPSIKLWDLHAEKLLGSIRGGGISIAFSPNGKTLASGAVDNTVRLWRMEPDNEGSVLTGHTERVLSVAVSPDGGLVASSSLDSQLKLWDSITGRERATLKSGGAPFLGLAFSRDGKLLASQSATGYATLWDVTTGTRLRQINFPRALGFSRSIALSPDAMILARGDEGGGIVLCDVAAGVFREPLKKRSGSVVGLAFSPNGEMLASTVERETVEVWTVATGKLVHDLGDRVEPCGLPAFSPDGRVLACGCFDGKVQLWNVSTGNLLSTLEGHVGQVSSVVFSADGRTLFSAAYDGTIKLWDMKTLRQRVSLKGSREAILSIALSRDGTVLVSGGTAGTVRLWQAATEDDPQKLVDLLQLETGIRDLAEADVDEQHKTLSDVDAYLAGKVEAGLTPHDIALADSAAWALALRGNDKLVELFSRSDDRKLRELAASWQITSWQHRAELYVRNNQLEEAIVAFSRLFELRPDDSLLRLERGLLHVRLSQWKEAADDYAEAVELHPEDVATWLHAAPLFILAGNEKEYSRHCEEMLKFFGANGKVADADKTSKASLLLANAFDLTKLPLETVNRALDDGSTPSWFPGWGFGTRALAAYRAGDAVKAVRWVRKSQETQTYADKPQLRAQVLAVLAMAQHQTEHSEDAQEALTQASELIDAHMPKLATGALGSTWPDWLIAEILRREAEALMRQRAGSPAEKDKQT